jgi:Lysozyme like domain
MYQHILGVRRSVRAVLPLRLGIVAVMALVALALPAPATAAADTSDAAAADLCAEVGSRAGFRGDRLVTAVAVGMAESSCRPNAQNANGPTKGCPNGSVDRGLWQINSCWHPSVSKSCAYDAQCNANSAYRISAQGTNFRPWAAYTNGSYKKHLAEARAAVGRLSRT